ncbi:hypothetical protein PUN28_007097 [Cardiocondyla obscurior]|uniref:Uncharacterized protein n=1 Tax=Cardiocondyla obscurior TaxID=286306 RepID=A0AAW2G3D1_9HYME
MILCFFNTVLCIIYDSNNLFLWQLGHSSTSSSCCHLTSLPACLILSNCTCKSIELIFYIFTIKFIVHIITITCNDCDNLTKSFCTASLVSTLSCSLTRLSCSICSLNKVTSYRSVSSFSYVSVRLLCLVSIYKVPPIHSFEPVQTFSLFLINLTVLFASGTTNERKTSASSCAYKICNFLNKLCFFFFFTNITANLAVIASLVQKKKC